MYGPGKKPLVWSWPPVSRHSQFKSQPAADPESATPAVGAPAPEESAPSATGTPAEVTAMIGDAYPPEDQSQAEEQPPAGREVMAETGDAAVDAQARPCPPGMPMGPYVPPPGQYYPPEPQGPELARAYIPIQRFGPTFNPAEALQRGTLFPELYRPYNH